MILVGDQQMDNAVENHENESVENHGLSCEENPLSKAVEIPVTNNGVLMDLFEHQFQKNLLQFRFLAPNCAGHFRKTAIKTVPRLRSS